MEVVRNVRELTAVLEQFSETTGTVRGLELTSEGDSTDGEVVASVTVEYDLASECTVDPDRLSVSSPAASMTDGRLRLDLDVALAPPATEDAGKESAPAEHGATDGDPEPADAPVARADGSGARGSEGSASVASVVSPPTMEFAISTGRDELSEDDQSTPASSDGPVEADTETSPDTDTDMAPDTSTDTEPDADAKADADSVPAHHDPVRLREAYEACETFKEMTDALGVDVTPQTVRNQMIQRGIHEPESYGASPEPAASSESTESSDEPQQPEPSVADVDSTSETDQSPTVGTEDTDIAAVERDTTDDAETDANDESTSVSESKLGSESEPQSETDPATDTEPDDETDKPPTTEDASTVTALPPLPASVSSLDCSTEDVCAAVTGAKTLYEVERCLGLNRADVREVLTALDLLDLVTGRMARRDASAASADDVRTRVHAALVEGTE